jgi:acetylornithine deacetylase/succinyl-diaminopimelate desuccinylase-like protein
MDLLTLCRDLIAADTVSHKGTSAAVKILKPLYEAAGLQVTVQEVERDGVLHQNLLGTYPGTDPRGLLLVTHLDTVDPGPPELWTETGGAPHALTRSGDRLYGLGSADTKLDSLCKLFAARHFEGKPLRRQLQLLGTFEEEVGCKGARHFASSPLLTARFAACSEPSELTIIRAHKGYAVVRCIAQLEGAPLLEGRFTRRVFEGKAAHSSTPHLGVNAIEKALAALGNSPLLSLDGGTVSNKVPARCTVVWPAAEGDEPVEVSDPGDARVASALAQELFALWKRLALAQQPQTNPAFDPDRCVVNWGVARLSASRLETVFDCRLLPGHDPDALVEGFIREARALSEGRTASFEVEIERASPAMELKEPSELLEGARAACRDVGLNDRVEAKPTNTEAGVFASRGVEAIVFGPGRSTGNAHCANEHNLYSQLEKAIEFHRALISRLCL